MVTQIGTAFKMGCMAAAGYGAGTVLKVNPKAMALTWLCGEVALQVFTTIRHLPPPRLLAGSLVTLHLSTQQLIEDNLRSHSIMIGAFAISSILIDTTANLFNKLCQAASRSHDDEDVYPRRRNGTYTLREDDRF